MYTAIRRISRVCLNNRFFHSSHDSGSNPKATYKTILFHTDSEGSKHFFQESIAKSSVVTFKGEELTLNHPASGFIFGGDFSTKATFGFRLGRLLVHFKQRSPEQVTLLAGNRDIMTMRFSRELHGDTIRNRLLNDQPVFWVPKFSATQYLINFMKEQGINQSPSSYIYSLPVIACQTIYLKWMLKYTMGCGVISHTGEDTFEIFRQEIMEIENRKDVSDEDVTQYILNQVQPGGVYYDYLDHAQLNMVVGDTLFLHGAVTKASLGYVPGIDKEIDNPVEWLAMLNHWYRTEVIQWQSSPYLKPEERPAQFPLDKYLIANSRNIVSNNWYIDNRIVPLSDRVVDYLGKAGIRRVVSGHQPFSDFPFVMRHESGFEIIVGDTSYSDTTALNNRGQAHHCLEIDFNHNGVGNVRVDAVRRTGLRQRVNLAEPYFSDLGKIADDGGIIRLDEHGQWVSSLLDGYKVIDRKLLKNNHKNCTTNLESNSVLR